LCYDVFVMLNLAEWLAGEAWNIHEYVDNVNHGQNPAQLTVTL